MNKKGFSVIEMLITAAVLCFVSYYVVKTYFGKNATGNTIDNKTKIELATEGIKTNTLPEMTNSAQSAADKANKTIEEQENLTQQTDLQDN